QKLIEKMLCLEECQRSRPRGKIAHELLLLCSCIDSNVVSLQVEAHRIPSSGVADHRNSIACDLRHVPDLAAHGESARVPRKKNAHSNEQNDKRHRSAPGPRNRELEFRLAGPA